MFRLTRTRGKRFRTWRVYKIDTDVFIEGGWQTRVYNKLDQWQSFDWQNSSHFWTGEKKKKKSFCTNALTQCGGVTRIIPHQKPPFLTVCLSPSFCPPPNLMHTVGVDWDIFFGTHFKSWTDERSLYMYIIPLLNHIQSTRGHFEQTELSSMKNLIKKKTLEDPNICFVDQWHVFFKLISSGPKLK